MFNLRNAKKLWEIFHPLLFTWFIMACFTILFLLALPKSTKEGEPIPSFLDPKFNLTVSLEPWAQSALVQTLLPGADGKELGAVIPLTILSIISMGPYFLVILVILASCSIGLLLGLRYAMSRIWCYLTHFRWRYRTWRCDYCSWYTRVDDFLDIFQNKMIKQGKTKNIAT